MKGPDKFSHKDRRSPIAIVLDNHQLFAESFGKIVQDFYVFNDVHVFTDKLNLVSFLIRLPSDSECFFFLDYYLGDETVLPIISDIKRINKNSRIIIVTVASNPAMLRNLVNHSKIDGVLSKYSGVDDVVDCINRVVNKEKFVADFFNKILENASVSEIPLTDRELEIVQMAAQGMTVDLTAQKLNISRHTVAAHRRKILAKTSCPNMTSLLIMAREMKWI